MRLIDADALISEMEADAEHMEDMIFKMATYAAINNVKHAPTIEERTPKRTETHECDSDRAETHGDDCISRAKAMTELQINAKRMTLAYEAHGMGKVNYSDEIIPITDALEVLRSLPSAEPELLTDKEQRIFLAAMGREGKVCKEVDEECLNCKEPYEDSLVKVCKEITRKVKGALWT